MPNVDNSNDSKRFVAALLTNAFINAKIMKANAAGDINEFVASLEARQMPKTNEDLQTFVWKTYQKYYANLNKD